MATFFCDLTSGNDSNDGTSFAQRVLTLSRASNLASPGDTIRVMGSPAPTSLAQNATWTNSNGTNLNTARAVTLTSAVTANIELCETSWTGATNVTASTTSTCKQGSAAITLASNGSFTTGKMGYKSFTTTDFSSYQQVSFWIKQTSGTVAAASTLSIVLCSDTTGDTPATGGTSNNTFTIPFALVSSQFICVTIDAGGGLPNDVQSVALYTSTNPFASRTIVLDNILACKASSSDDALTLNSLIGKNTGNETWWAIRSINGTAVVLDTDPNSTASTSNSSGGRGYSGTTETVTTYKREYITGTLATSSSTAVQTIGGSGSSGSPRNWEFGYNTSDMTTQNLETWIGGRNGLGYGISLSGQYNNLNKVALVQFYNGINISGANNSCTTITAANNCGNYGIALASNTNSLSTVTACVANSSDGINITTGTGQPNTITTVLAANSNNGIGINGASGSNFVGTATASNNGSYGIKGNGTKIIGTSWTTNYNSTAGVNLVTTNTCTINSLSATGNGSYGLEYSGGPFHHILSFTTSGNGTSAIRYATSSPTHLYFYNATMSESTKISGTTTGSEQFIWFQKYGTTANDHRLYQGSQLITSTDTSTTHGSSVFSWKATISSSYNQNEYNCYPVKLSPIGIASGSQVTVSAWVRRDSTNNTARIRIPGSYVAGVGSDVTATCSASANTWQQIQVQFTPSESNVGVPVFFEAYGGTAGVCYVADLSVSQA